MKLINKKIIVISIAHLMILLASILISFTSSMDRFDTGTKNISTLELITGTISKALSFPGRHLWELVPKNNILNIFEWLILICNSALWGFVINYIYQYVKQHITSQANRMPKSGESS